MPHWSDFLDADAPDGAYLPWKKVEHRVGISRTTAWRLQKTGDFPKPYVMSPGRVAYRESEVEAWKASRGHRSAQALARSVKSADTRRAPARPAASAPPDRAPPPSARQGASQEGPRPEAPRATQSAKPPLRSRRNASRGDQMTFDF